jgi:hypothetical protein
MVLVVPDVSCVTVALTGVLFLKKLSNTIFACSLVEIPEEDGVNNSILELNMLTKSTVFADCIAWATLELSFEALTALTLNIVRAIIKKLLIICLDIYINHAKGKIRNFSIDIELF